MNRTISDRDQFWINHIKNFNSSELSGPIYCKNHGLNYKTFTARKSNLKIFINPLESQKFDLKNCNSNFKVKLSSGIELIFDELPNSKWLIETITKLGNLNA